VGDGGEGWYLANGRPYKVLPRGDFGAVYQEVVSALEDGACIGIFPEGGSHDNTDLLSLKPGAALMAMGCELPVPIVPVGLTYSHGHLFRSAKVTVHAGPPIFASPSEKVAHAQGGDTAQAATSALLTRIERSMRDVIVPAASYDELQTIHLARRLWLGPDRQNLLPSVKQDLDRRFAFGIKCLYGLNERGAVEAEGEGGQSHGGGAGAGAGAGKRSGGGGGGGGVEDARREVELSELKQRLRAYDRELRRLGLRDSQVPTLQRAPVSATLFTLGHMLFMLSIASLPSAILNAPVGLAAVLWSKWRQRKALASSCVKLSAYDVLLSEKMKIAIVGVPTLWAAYAALLLLATSMQPRDVLTLLMVAPVASYLGVISTESGMIALRDLGPMIARLVYSRRRVEALKAEQLSLSRIIRGEIRRLVESNEVVRELYHTQGQLSSTEWERFRAARYSRESDELNVPPSPTATSPGRPRYTSRAKEAADPP